MSGEAVVITDLTTPRGQSVSNALQLHAGTGVLTGLSIVCPVMEPDHTISVEISTDGVTFYPLMFQGALVLLPITGRAYHLPVVPSADFIRLRCSQVETEDRVFKVGTVYTSAVISNFPAVQPVSATALPLPSGASTEATLALIKAKTDNLDVALSTRTKPSDIQRAQDLKDTSRTYVVLSYDRITGIIAEALATLTINKGGVTSTATTYTVTVGKTLRLQSLYMELLNSTVNANRSLVRIRSGASVTVSSPVVAMGAVTGPAGGAGATIGGATVTFPDGLEIAGGQQVGVSHLENVTTAGIASMCLAAFEY